jgi:hypothetical protein
MKRQRRRENSKRKITAQNAPLRQRIALAKATLKIKK